MPSFRGVSYAAFLFDMDGTLIDSSAAVERVWTQWADPVGIAPSKVLAFAHGVRAQDVVRRFADADADLSAELDWLEAVETADLGVAAIRGAQEYIRSLDPDAWAIVTSAPRKLAVLRLLAAGLLLPRVIVTADDVTKGKPDPDGFKRAAAMLEVRARECLAFEDSEAGVSAALAAGARVVVVGDRLGAGYQLPQITDYA